ncbi:odorant receptor 46a-like [Achroia grisella]|uniref:odorant receptor 46a-like n=1 Tax=Achroia grisella TaxID=688607 RepID=UPI0027D346F9|nr:odorant receptor 46a-like [Achroia grisella]
MESLNLINCFEINIKIWKIIGLWPANYSWKQYNILSKIFIAVMVFIFDMLITFNLFFITKHLDLFIENILFYFTALVSLSKAITFLTARDLITNIFYSLQRDIFQPNNDDELKIIKRANSFNITYWKIVAIVSLASHIAHIIVPIIMHLVFSEDLQLPACDYSFLSKEFFDKFKYLLYLYQCFGIQYIILINLNVDTFILGLMVLTIAQLDVLALKLRNVTDLTNVNEIYCETATIERIHNCVKHFEEIARFCSQVQRVFSFIIFVQFSMASCIICVCLFRMTMPAPIAYDIFLVTYMCIVILQILVPSWFGSKIVDKSQSLTIAAYSCAWIPRSRRFKSSLRLFVERVNVPLCIVGGKMFVLCLNTFTSIMNSAYSFFTLLRHMQAR